MATRPTTPKPDDSAGITTDVDEGPVPDELVADEPATAEPAGDVVLPKVKARYVGIEPVATHVDGAVVIIEPGDPIFVTTEQLEQNPVFESWED